MMDIAKTGYSSRSNTAVYAEKIREKSAVEKNAKPSEEESTTSVNQDSFVQAGSDKPVTYSKKLPGTQVQQLKDEQARRMESFVQMLRSMVVKQGQQSNLTLFGVDFHVTPEQSRQAAASIGEGGEYSVDAVAGRIMDMAKALSGGDPDKIAVLREAVQKGFRAAGAELGGQLPSICGRTYDEIMRRFDEWEKESEDILAGAAE